MPAVRRMENSFKEPISNFSIP